jgi:hypothetical protein
MKRCLIVIALLSLFSGSATAQEKLFVGEESLIMRMSFYGSCMPLMVQGPLYPYTRFHWNTSTYEVTSFFDKPGTYFDTASFYIYYPSGNCQMSGKQTFYAQAVVYGDSVIRMLPRNLQANALADKINGGWTTTLTHRIKHKIGTTSTFSDWKLTIDTSLKASLEVKNAGASITNLLVQPFEDSVNLEYVIKLGHGPIYQDQSYEGMISVRVKNKDKDSIYTTPIKLNVVKPYWNPWIGFSSDTIRMTAKAGEVKTGTVGLKLDPRTTSYTLTPLQGTIASSPTTLVAGDSITATLTGYARTAGTYTDRWDLWTIIPDQNGEPRTTVDSVWIELTVTGGTQEPFWEATDGSIVNAKYIATHHSGEVFAAGDQLFRTTNDGSQWTRVPTVDTTIHGLVVTNNRSVFVIGDNRYVRSSTDMGGRWDTAKIGGSYYYNGKYLPVPYKITRLLGAGDNVYAEGSGDYYDPYEHRPKSLSGWQGTHGYGPVWNGFDFSQSRFYYQTLSAMAQDSSLHYLLGNHQAVYHHPTEHMLNVYGRTDVIAVDGFGYFYALTSNGLYVSTDVGYSWQRKSMIFDSVRGFAVAGDGELFVATASAVYHSTDHGVEWEVINAGLGSTKITSLGLLAGGKVFVGTLGGGVYRSIANTKLAEWAAVSRPNEGDQLGRVVSRGDRRWLKLLDAEITVQACDVLGRTIDLHVSDGMCELPNGPLFMRLMKHDRSQRLQSR